MEKEDAQCQNGNVHNHVGVGYPVDAQIQGDLQGADEQGVRQNGQGHLDQKDKIQKGILVHGYHRDNQEPYHHGEQGGDCLQSDILGCGQSQRRVLAHCRHQRVREQPDHGCEDEVNHSNYGDSSTNAVGHSLTVVDTFPEHIVEWNHESLLEDLI